MNNKRIAASMLWAAYGDALGFITELADGEMVRNRVGRAGRVEGLTTWTRRVGGRFGAFVEMPIGCYSDDTQLRLATCRSVKSDGSFDVDSFAKVELPVWRSYALGAGRGSKAAAKALAKADVQWWGNFFVEGKLRYTEGGGNGAAMRIQPHVWAAKEKSRESDIVKVILRNAITTHGHARGFLGAVFHGLCLWYVFHEETAPDIKDLLGFADKLRYVGNIVRADKELNTFWLGAWEQKSRTTIDDAVSIAVDEVVKDIKTLTDIGKSRSQPQDAYNEGVEAIGGLDQSSRGSGTKTAILAAFLVSLFKKEPDVGVLVAANCLGSDTDTIATMAGAIFGAVTKSEPPERVADSAYLSQEADRIAEIRAGKSCESFSYPDLLTWQPPKAEIDYLRSRNDGWYVAGLGKAKAVGEETIQKGKSPSIWQWYKLEFGQEILLKRRLNPAAAKKELLLFDDVSAEVKKDDTLNLDQAKSEASKSSYAPDVVGSLIMRLARGENGTEDAVAFAAYIAEAQRQKRNRSSV